MEPTDTPPVGRRISRRSRRGFAFSDGGIADSSLGGGVDGDINAHVEAQAVTPVATIQPRNVIPAAAQGGVNTQEDFNPRDRMAQVRTRASGYEREYRLRLLHRLLMRNVPVDEIADQLGLSISQVFRDRQELTVRLRQEAISLDVNELIGDSKAFYEEAAAMSMRAASSSSLPMPIRLAAVRTALASKNDLHRFLHTAGVYDVLRFRKAADGTGVSDVRQLMLNTERILAGEAPSFSSSADSGDQETVSL